jgi:hypothetical protein
MFCVHDINMEGYVVRKTMLEDWLLSFMSTLAIGFWTPQLIEVGRHERNYTCRYHMHGGIV